MTELLAPKRMVELEVDGQAVRSSRAPRSSTPAEARDRHPDALLRRDARSLRTPAASASSRSKGARVLAPGLRPEGRSGDEGADRLRARASLAQARARAARLVGRPLDDPRRPGYLERYDAEPERFGPPAPPTPDRDRARTGHHVEPDGRTAATVHQPVKLDNELYVRDYSKCILCYKCVDACGEQYQNTFAIHVAGRGFDARISTELTRRFPSRPVSTAATASPSARPAR